MPSADEGNDPMMDYFRREIEPHMKELEREIETIETYMIPFAELKCPHNDMALSKEHEVIDGHEMVIMVLRCTACHEPIGDNADV